MYIIVEKGVNLMKKIFLWTMATFIVLITVAITWVLVNHLIHSQIEDRKAREFIEEKYGMDAKIVDETNANFVDGHSYQMAFTEQEDVVFTVTVDVENYSTIYRDDYEAVRKQDRLEQQMEKLIPEIEAIGFTAPSTGELVQHIVKDMRTGEAVHWIDLTTSSNYSTIEREEIQEMKNLLDLQREHGVDIQKINIGNKQGVHMVTLDMREMGEVHSVEELEAHVVGGDLRLAGERMQAKWQDAATQAETERFRFYDKWVDQWISCQQVNDQGDCINLLASVTFEAGEFSQQNPHLEEDLDAIFNFFDSIEPKLIAVDLVMVDPEREGNPVRFFLRERENYASTEELIADLVKD